MTFRESPIRFTRTDHVVSSDDYRADRSPSWLDNYNREKDRVGRGTVAEAVVVVCDECGKPDATSVTIRVGERNYVKDLCGQHLATLLKDTRAPRRGRPRVSGPTRKGRAKPPATQRRGGRAASRSSGAKKRSPRKKTTKTRG